ncbi:MAG TPA: ATP-binding protein [Methylomirabilota bacterium]|nr:ATP-binding protein [Methylomirabilota bacterium]
MKRLLRSRFTVLSLLAVAGLGLAMGLVTSSLLTRAVSDWEWENTAALVRREVAINGLEVLFTAPAAPGSGPRWRELSRLLTSLPEVVRVKVWDTSATILWSDEADLIGRRFPDNHELRQALQGTLEVEIRSLGKAEHGYERPAFTVLAEVYVPIRTRGGEVLGVVEVYKTPERLRATIRWTRTVIAAIAVAGGLLLFLVLRPLLGQVYRRHVEEETLRAYAGQLEAEVAQRTEQLLQAQKMEAVGLLAGGIAHDFNNLLTVILSYATLGLQRLGRDTPVATGLEIIQQTAERAALLVRHLLAFSRRQKLEPRVLDLNCVVTDMGEMLRPLLGEDITLVTVPGLALDRVSADQSQLEQVVMNLAVNARDAMPQGGRLVLETANVDFRTRARRPPPGLREDRYVLLAVSDTGTGMDAATRARIFDPFFTTKGPGRGTGLGLSTVYGIVKQHDGHIAVESAPGQGTTFRIYLPRVEAPAPPPPTARRAPAPAPPHETILVVEDEDAVRAVTVEILRGHGYTVLEAADGLEALRLVARHAGPLDLLLTDIVMPQLSGWQLARRLADVRPETKTMFMTGYSEIALAHDGASGAPVLQKPFRPDTLLRTVQETLAGLATAP